MRRDQRQRRINLGDQQSILPSNIEIDPIKRKKLNSTVPSIEATLRQLLKVKITRIEMFKKVGC